MKPTDRVQVRGVGGSFESEIEAIEPDGGIVVRKGSRRMVVAPDRVRLLDKPQPTRAPLERPAVYDAPAGVPVPKDPPGRSEAYLDFVREHACCYCCAPPRSEAHHYAPTGRGGGMGMKCDDHRTVPLCSGCHRHFHDHGKLARDFGCDETHALFMETQVLLLIEWIARGSK